MNKPTQSHPNDKAVIFDLDGVLVDTGWAHKQSWYDLADREGFEMTDEFFQQTFGMQNRRIIPMLLGPDVTEQQIERLSDIKEQRYRDIIGEKLVLADGVQALLDDLKTAGFAMAVGSSAPRANLDMILQRLSIGRFFDALVTKEDITNGKPAPDTFLKAAEKLSVTPARSVVVEDAVQGVQAAKAAQMAVLAVTSTRSAQDLRDASADKIVDSLAQTNARTCLDLIDSANRP